MDKYKIDKCPYCGGLVKLTDSKVIYGRSYGDVYVCDNFPQCNAYVGVHKGTTTPLGRLADAELRRYKKLAHAQFDRIWYTKRMKRAQAYKWLSQQLGIPAKETHIGWFDVEMCKRVVDVCRQYFEVSN